MTFAIWPTDWNSRSIGSLDLAENFTGRKVQRNSSSQKVWLSYLLFVFWTAERMGNLRFGLQPVDHRDIGIHFERFDGRRYVANAKKMAHYPDDDAAARLLLNSLQRFSP